MLLEYLKYLNNSKFFNNLDQIFKNFTNNFSHNKVLSTKVHHLNRNVPLHNKNKINNLKYSNLNLWENKKGKQIYN